MKCPCCGFKTSAEHKRQADRKSAERATLERLGALGVAYYPHQSWPSNPDLLSLDTYVAIRTRGEAWKALGIPPSAAENIGRYTFTPRELERIGLDLLRQIDGIGPKSMALIETLLADLDDATARWQAAYDSNVSWCQRYEEKRFPDRRSWSVSSPAGTR